MSESNTKYTVLPKLGFNTDDEYQTYRKLMDERGLQHAPCKRVAQPDGTVSLPKVATCVWNSEAEAKSFARELRQRTRSEWVVRETDL